MHNPTLKLKELGFTLLELTLALAINSIVLLVAMQLTGYVNQIASRSNADLDFTNMLSEVSNRLTDRTPFNSTISNDSICLRTLGPSPMISPAPVVGVPFNMTLYNTDGSVFLNYTPTAFYLNKYRFVTVNSISYTPSAIIPPVNSLGVVNGFLTLTATPNVPNRASAEQAKLSSSIQMNIGYDPVSLAIKSCGIFSPNVSKPQPIVSCTPGSALTQQSDLSWGCRAL